MSRPYRRLKPTCRGIDGKGEPKKHWMFSGPRESDHCFACRMTRAEARRPLSPPTPTWPFPPRHVIFTPEELRALNLKP